MLARRAPACTRKPPGVDAGGMPVRLITPVRVPTVRQVAVVNDFEPGVCRIIVIGYE